MRSILSSPKRNRSDIDDSSDKHVTFSARSRVSNMCYSEREPGDLLIENQRLKATI